jgi:hypothetical protein
VKSSVALLMLIALTVPGMLKAQPCPQGIPQGAPGCVPPNHPNLPSNASAPAKPVRAVWRKTWGAMATDTDTAVIGTSTGHFTRRAASREAMEKCRNMGGRACEVRLSYENQCALIAVPTSDGSMVAVYQSGPSVEHASKLALPECAKRNGGRQCEVMYSNCTAPVLVH